MSLSLSSGVLPVRRHVFSWENVSWLSVVSAIVADGVGAVEVGREFEVDWPVALSTPQSMIRYRMGTAEAKIELEKEIRSLTLTASVCASPSCSSTVQNMYSRCCSTTTQALINSCCYLRPSRIMLTAVTVASRQRKPTSLGMAWQNKVATGNHCVQLTRLQAQSDLVDSPPSHYLAERCTLP